MPSNICQKRFPDPVDCGIVIRGDGGICLVLGEVGVGVVSAVRTSTIP